MAIHGEVVVPGAGAMVKQGFDATEMTVSADVQSAALQAQATAEVQARWLIAQKCPRNLDGVRVRLLAECKRPGFALAAEYSKPVGGKKAIGPSIRFVEQALRCLTNVYAATTVISEDQFVRRMQVVVTDLEANVSWPRQISIEKTVERSDTNGRKAISERLNSYGKKTFLVAATEDELLNKENAAISKAIRTAGLRILPGDLVDEAMAMCKQVRDAAVKADPTAARKRMVDAFAAVGVSPEQLAEYLGHGLDSCNPSEIDELRGLHEAIKDGESKWSDAMELKRSGEPVGQVQAPPKPQSPPAPAPAVPAPAAVISPPAAAQPPPAPVASTPTPEDAAKVQAAFDAAVTAAEQPPAADEDPLTKETNTLLGLIAAAQKKADLAKIAGRVRALPTKERATAMAAYTKRGQELAS